MNTSRNLIDKPARILQFKFSAILQSIIPWRNWSKLRIIFKIKLNLM